MTPGLQHFVDAQAPIYAQVLRELTDGEKRSHWMWFIFPQLAGLGRSPTAQRYALADRAQAAAYLAHAVLGPRLRECVSLVNTHRGRPVAQIFGYPDDLKFHSSLTLFHEAAPAQPEFTEGLRYFYDGAPDAATLTLLGRGSP
ncbi:MAG TPA: DUF1810 domain-containing protein [Steroidobacteraceae bacterium]|nr:DUF1810 domain-containing protein [Steroidobacteraceae bacterium]